MIKHRVIIHSSLGSVDEVSIEESLACRNCTFLIDFPMGKVNLNRFSIPNERLLI